MATDIKYVTVVILARSSRRKNVFIGRTTENELVKVINEVKSDAVGYWLYHVLRNHFRSKWFPERYDISERLKKKLYNDYRHQVETIEGDIELKELPKEVLPLKYQGNRVTYFKMELGQDWLNKFRDIAEFLDKETPRDIKKLTAPKVFELYETYLAKSRAVIEKTLVLKCDNGYNWYRLDNDAARIYEGSQSRNCIGSKEHHQGIKDGTIIFLSLQKSNKSYLTLKYNPKTHKVEEVKGKGNSVPKDDFWPYICDIANHLKLFPVGDAEQLFKDFIRVDGKWKPRVKIKSSMLENERIHYLYL